MERMDALSRADQHAIVDEYYKLQLDEVDMSDPMAFYVVPGLLWMWREAKLDIENPQRAELRRATLRSL